MPTNPTNKPNEVSDEQFRAAIFEDGGHLVVDMGSIQEAKFEVVPKGIYSADIDSAEYGLSQNSGAPMLTLQCMISEGQFQGRKLYTYWSFSQKALPYTKAAIARVAPELLKGKFKPEQVANEGTLLGKPCRIRVTVEDYNGEPRSRIAQVLQPTTGDQMNQGTSSGNGSTSQAKGFF